MDSSLLAQIQQGKSLKKAVTNDRSAPRAAERQAPSSEPFEAQPSTTREGSKVSERAAALALAPGGLFANGFPQLRKTVALAPERANDVNGGSRAPDCCPKPSKIPPVITSEVSETAAEAHACGSQWNTYRTPDGIPYYYNMVTGTTSWSLPADLPTPSSSSIEASSCFSKAIDILREQPAGSAVPTGAPSLANQAGAQHQRPASPPLRQAQPPPPQTQPLPREPQSDSTIGHRPQASSARPSSQPGPRESLTAMPAQQPISLTQLPPQPVQTLPMPPHAQQPPASSSPLAATRGPQNAAPSPRCAPAVSPPAPTTAAAPLRAAQSPLALSFPPDADLPPVPRLSRMKKVFPSSYVVVAAPRCSVTALPSQAMKASLAGANRASSHPPKPPPPPPKSASAAVVQSSSRSASAKTACDAAAAARCQTAPMEAPTQQQQTSPAAVASVRPAAVVPPPRPPRSAGRGGTRPPPPPPPRASSAASSTRCQQQPPAVASVQFHPYGGNPVSECRAVENPVHPLNGNSRALANEPANLLPSASQAPAALGCPGPTARVETDQHTFSVSSLHSIVANLEMQMAQASASSNFERCIELRPELRAAKAALLDQSIQQASAAGDFEECIRLRGEKQKLFGSQ